MSDIVSITFVIPSVLNPGGGGEEKIPINVSSLSDAFAKVVDLRGPDFARRVMEPDGKTPRQLINVYVNGKNAKFAGGMDMALQEGDEVYILPAVAGGGNSGSSSSSSVSVSQEINHSENQTMELDSKDLERFSRQVMLEQIGYNGQLKLKQARVCVVGSGGLGNPICVRLATMGVGHLRIIDRDTIELTNLHRQVLFDDGDVGQVKVEVAARKLRALAPDCDIEPIPMSISDANAVDAIRGCDVVVDALDSVNARYALNKACIKLGIPFVTGAAVGVSGQVFTILPKKTACYYCMFPDLNEDEMPTCSIEGVHPSILSVVGGIEVSETVNIIMGKDPVLSERILHIDIEEMNFNKTRTFRAAECPVCGDNIQTENVKLVPENTQKAQQLILEELCGRNRGKRTFAITPPVSFDVDVDAISNMARQKGFLVENQGDLGLSMRTLEFSVSVMKKGSAVVVGAKDEQGAINLYNDLIKNTQN